MCPVLAWAGTDDDALLQMFMGCVLWCLTRFLCVPLCVCVCERERN